jgi:hypothetical protein
MVKTKSAVPCGAIEEVSEIYEAFDSLLSTPETTRLFAINLKGHGCILIAKDVEIFKELQKHKDNCFVQRPVPEKT